MANNVKKKGTCSKCGKVFTFPLYNKKPMSVLHCKPCRRKIIKDISIEVVIGNYRHN